MEITKIEVFDKIVKEKVEADFKLNAYNIKRKIYSLYKRCDSDGRNKGYYLDNSDLHGKDLAKLMYKVFEEREYKMIYDFFGMSPIIIRPEITFANCPLEKERCHVNHYEYIEIDEMKLLTAIETCTPMIIPDEEGLENVVV